MRTGSPGHPPAISGTSGHSPLDMSAATLAAGAARRRDDLSSRVARSLAFQDLFRTCLLWRQTRPPNPGFATEDPLRWIGRCLHAIAAMEHSVPAQNVPTVEYYGMNITESSDAGITKFSEHYAERISTAGAGESFAAIESRVGEQEILVESASLQISGGGNGDVSSMHEDLSLQRFSGLGQMDVDESRDASHGTGFDGFDVKYESGPSAENMDQTEGFREVAKFGGKNANSDAPQAEVEFNVAKPDFEQHLVLSGNMESRHPPLPEHLREQVVKADQNDTPPVGEQPPKTPVTASDSVSKEAGVAEARDTSSIPGISMLAGKSIPPVLFKQEEVIANKELFSEALNKFHTVLGTRLTKKGRGGRERAAEVKSFEESIAGIPKLGGNDLDLHLLYKEVTSRGGLEQVIKDRKWKEVTNCFKEAETATSASYILRKYYVGLLYYFEQAYLHGKTGPLIPPPISMPGPSPMSVKRSDSGLGIIHVPTEGQPGFKRTRKRKILPMQAMPVMDPAQQIGHTVRSTIEGKCELGYLVSVTVGTEKMRGILYHVPPMQRAPQHATIPNYEATIGAEPIIIREEPSLRGIKRKRRRADDMPKKDPNAPRPNRTGYNFFFAEQRARLKALHPEKDKELSRMIGDAWNSLMEEEKAPYQERGVQDKERYKIELRDYLELQKSQNGKIPTESAAGHAIEDAKENLKEAVVDAAIDVAVDVAVNNAVDVSIDDVVEATTEAVTDATVGSNHSLPAAAASDVAAAHDTTGMPDVSDIPGLSSVVDATNGSCNPIAAVDVDNGAPANTPTFATVGPNTTLDVDDGIPNAVSDAPDGSVNLLASMDIEIEPQQPEFAPQQLETFQQPL